MKKQLEVGKTYPTRNELATGEVLCNDLSDIYPCGVKITVKATGKKSFHSYTMEGHIQIGSTAQGLDLIIPQPEPTHRAWKEDEIPVGAKVRSKHGKSRAMLILSTEKDVDGVDGIMLPHGISERANYFISVQSALRDLEYFNGTSWQPCGVLE